jgi:hypothetical protein
MKNKVDKFIKLEYENNLFEKKIDNFSYWNFIRTFVYAKAAIPKADISATVKKSSLSVTFNKILLKLSQIPNFISKNPLWFLKQKDVMIINASNRFKNGVHYDCIFTDELLVDFKHSYYVFEEAYLEKHFKPIRTKNIKYMDYVYFKESMKKILYKPFFNISKYEKEIADIKEIVKKVNTEFGTEISEEEVINKVFSYYLSYKFVVRYYEKILDRVKPKVIIEVCHYTFDRLAINELAKKRNIKIIELQHGTMGEYHESYNFYKKMDITTFPDYILLFGEFWKSTTRFPIGENKLIVTGYPYFESMISTYKEKSKKYTQDKKIILFISQGPVGIELSKVATELNNLIDKNNYKIVYKLHPGEFKTWKTDYPWLIDKDIEVVDTREKVIYDYFAVAKYQVGVYSTAIFEGLAFNLRTFILKAYGHELTEQLYENGHATLIESALEIYNCLEDDSIDHNKIKDEFWKDNALNNIKRAVDKIIKDEI